MEIHTGQLNLMEMQAELDTIVSLLQGRKAAFVELMYGWDCAVDSDYQPFSVLTANLPAFLNKSRAKDVWRLGSSDLHITVPILDTEFLLCHESDIHIKSGNAEVLDFFRCRWLTSKYAVYEKQGEKGNEVSA